MAKFRYCERVQTHFPVVFAGEAYVGEGTVLNVSVPGCAVHSRKRVQSGSYLEMRMLVPDTTSPLRVGLAKVRWCEGRRFGVEFIQMPGEDQVRLGRLVRKQVPLAPPARSSPRRNPAGPGPRRAARARRRPNRGRRGMTAPLTPRTASQASIPTTITAATATREPTTAPIVLRTTRPSTGAAVGCVGLPPGTTM